MFSPISYFFFFKAKRALNACHRGYGFTLPLRAACRIFSEIQKSYSLDLFSYNFTNPFWTSCKIVPKFQQYSMSKMFKKFNIY